MVRDADADAETVRGRVAVLQLRDREEVREYVSLRLREGDLVPLSEAERDVVRHGVGVGVRDSVAVQDGLGDGVSVGCEGVRVPVTDQMWVAEMERVGRVTEGVGGVRDGVGVKVGVRVTVRLGDVHEGVKREPVQDAVREDNVGLRGLREGVGLAVGERDELREGLGETERDAEAVAVGEAVRDDAEADSERESVGEAVRLRRGEEDAVQEADAEGERVGEGEGVRVIRPERVGVGVGLPGLRVREWEENETEDVPVEVGSSVGVGGECEGLRVGDGLRDAVALQLKLGVGEQVVDRDGVLVRLGVGGVRDGVAVRWVEADGEEEGLGEALPETVQLEVAVLRVQVRVRPVRLDVGLCERDGDEGVTVTEGLREHEVVAVAEGVRTAEKELVRDRDGVPVWVRLTEGVAVISLDFVAVADGVAERVGGVREAEAVYLPDTVREGVAVKVPVGETVRRTLLLPVGVVEWVDIVPEGEMVGDWVPEGGLGVTLSVRVREGVRLSVAEGPWEGEGLAESDEEPDAVRLAVRVAEGTGDAEGVSVRLGLHDSVAAAEVVAVGLLLRERVGECEGVGV